MFLVFSFTCIVVIFPSSYPWAKISMNLSLGQIRTRTSQNPRGNTEHYPLGPNLMLSSSDRLRYLISSYSSSQACTGIVLRRGLWTVCEGYGTVWNCMGTPFHVVPYNSHRVPYGFDSTDCDLVAVLQG